MTKKFGIIGNPINHSLSPILHNYWFNKYSIDADYSVIEASDKDLPNIVDKIKNGKYVGINVTLPFKQKIINYIDKIVNDAELTGSVNTVLLDNDKTILGENTDVFGLQAAYLKEIDNSFLGEYLSAKTPPNKYEKNATTPYMENKPPNSRLVKLNTSRNVGLKTLANTYGRI